MPKLILASKSPRRRELLERMGLDHTAISVDADEHFPDGLSPEDVVKHISREKALAAASMVTAEDIVITADTMVFLDDKKLGKPASEEDAFSMLSALSGRAHTVCTGVTVMQGSKLLTEAESTRVYFAPRPRKPSVPISAPASPWTKPAAMAFRAWVRCWWRKSTGTFSM